MNYAQFSMDRVYGAPVSRIVDAGPWAVVSARHNKEGSNVGPTWACVVPSASVYSALAAENFDWGPHNAFCCVFQSKGAATRFCTELRAPLAAAA